MNPVSAFFVGSRRIGPTPGTLVPVVGPESPLLWWNGFPVAFALTCLIELPVYLLAFAALGWCRSRPSPHRPLTFRTALGLALAVNCLTHPVLWAMSLRQPQPGRLLTAELSVALVEGLLIFFVVLRRRGRETPASRLSWSLITALGVNTLSLLVGLVLLPLILSS
jgi:hypothetical protein